MSFLSGLFKRTTTLDLRGFTDYHCHILPGVDDGIETLDEALQVLQAYEQAGISEAWLTPHIMEDIPNKTSFLKDRFEELRNAYSGSVKLNLAAENMLDNLFQERLAEKDLLTLNGKDLLVETSYFSAPMRFTETLKQIQEHGYYPLLAHPERYNYIEDFEFYHKLKAEGVRFQGNLMSFYGYYGPAVKEKALYLLTNNLYDYLGSDLHSLSHIDILTEGKITGNIFGLLDSIIKK